MQFSRESRIFSSFQLPAVFLAILYVGLLIPLSFSWAESIVRYSNAPDGTQGDSFSAVAAISDDGRYTTFYSAATNLVAGDVNGFVDVFVYDRVSGDIDFWLIQEF